MIAKFKSKFQSENSKRISANFMYLSILQGMNLILPLITFPYLVRVLGIENFGLLMFAQAFIVYFTMIVDYGFNLSGIREVSSNRNNKSKLIKIFSSIMIARFILALVGLIFLTIIVFSFEKFSQNWELYYLTFGIVIGTALFPTWFFQGMEKMKYITVLTVIAKLIFTLSIFLFVTTEKDFIYVPLINSLGFIFVGFISLFIIFKDFNIRIKFQKWKRIKIQFIRGWYIFISKISINLYGATNTFILGIFTTDTIVGYYAIAEKVVRIITSLFAPFYQTIYPHVVSIVKKPKNEANNFLKKVFKYSLGISTIVFLLSVLLGEFSLLLVFGEEAKNSINIFYILSPLIIILPMAYLFFNVILLSFKLDKYFSKLYIIGGITNLSMIFILFQFLEEKIVAVSLSLLITELLIMLLAYILIKNKGLMD